MKKLYFLILFFGALLFCACEKENTDFLIEDQTQLDEGALKGVDSQGMTKEGLLPFPMWARMAAGSPNVIPTTDEYGIIIFYMQDPGIIPDWWDFLVDGWLAWPVMAFPDDFPPEVFSVDGDAWFLPPPPPPLFPVPHHYNMKGKGDVIIWIITYDEVMNLLEVEESITMPLLRDLNPLVGHATMYTEVLRPFGGGAKVLGGQFNAHGWLEDDKGRFILNMHTKVKEDQALESNVKFEIIDK